MDRDVHPTEAPRHARQRPSAAAGHEPDGALPPPAVAVVIPCYQQAEYLAAAVESVIGQTYADWEIVIVDDGSTDATAAVAEGLIAARPDRRIRLLREANGGVAAARNNGIAASTGRYVLPLDADDVLLPPMLERTVGLLEAEPGVAIAYTDFTQFGAADRRISTGAWNLDALAWANQLGISALYRREVWAAVGGYNPNMRHGYEDWDFWIGAAERGFTGRRIPEPLWKYRVRAASRDVGAWAHRRGLRRQIARNHPSVFTAGRRFRFTIRRATGAARYWVGRLYRRFGGQPDAGNA
jgi:glycosyltransferase involved in cell wall biosynthesis